MSTSLLIRPGARYECHGDGTCCTDIHLIGPLSRSEARRVRLEAERIFTRRKRRVVERHEGIDALVLTSVRNHCVFLDRNARCRLHRASGMDSKPVACRHFPLSTTATTEGVRVAVSHRCSCVALGPSARLTPHRARKILTSPTSGRLCIYHRTGARLKLRERRGVPFEQYVDWEKRVIRALDGPGRLPRIEHVLGMSAPDRLPRLRAMRWSEVARKLRDWVEAEPDDGFFSSLRWASRMLGRGWRDPALPLPPRPWAWTFDRASDRMPQPTTPRRIYGAWLADHLWSLHWTADGSLHRAMADMTARYVLATRIAHRLARSGIRNDLAAAEAVMIADTVGWSDPWGRVRKRLCEAPVGTFAGASAR